MCIAVICKLRRKRNKLRPVGFVWRFRDVVCTSGPKPVSSSVWVCPRRCLTDSRPALNCSPIDLSKRERERQLSLYWPLTRPRAPAFPLSTHPSVRWIYCSSFSRFSLGFPTFAVVCRRFHNSFCVFMCEIERWPITQRERMNGAPPCVKSPLESGQVQKGFEVCRKCWLVTMVTYSPLSISV